jgi:hypothetical protein
MGLSARTDYPLTITALVTKTSSFDSTGLTVEGTLTVNGALTVNGQQVGGSGASYDQDLNTTDDVVFNSALIGDVSIVGNQIGGVDSYGLADTLVVDGDLNVEFSSTSSSVQSTQFFGGAGNDFSFAELEAFTPSSRLIIYSPTPELQSALFNLSIGDSVYILQNSGAGDGTFVLTTTFTFDGSIGSSGGYVALVDSGTSISGMAGTSFIQITTTVTTSTTTEVLSVTETGVNVEGDLTVNGALVPAFDIDRVSIDYVASGLVFGGSANSAANPNPGVIELFVNPTGNIVAFSGLINGDKLLINGLEFILSSDLVYNSTGTSASFTGTVEPTTSSVGTITSVKIINNARSYEPLVYDSSTGKWVNSNMLQLVSFNGSTGVSAGSLYVQEANNGGSRNELLPGETRTAKILAGTAADGGLVIRDVIAGKTTPTTPNAIAFLQAATLNGDISIIEVLVSAININTGATPNTVRAKSFKLRAYATKINDTVVLNQIGTTEILANTDTDSPPDTDSLSVSFAPATGSIALNMVSTSANEYTWGGEVTITTTHVLVAGGACK